MISFITSTTLIQHSRKPVAKPRRIRLDLVRPHDILPRHPDQHATPVGHPDVHAARDVLLPEHGHLPLVKLVDVQPREEVHIEHLRHHPEALEPLVYIPLEQAPGRRLKPLPDIQAEHSHVHLARRVAEAEHFAHLDQLTVASHPLDLHAVAVDLHRAVDVVHLLVLPEELGAVKHDLWWEFSTRQA